MARHALQFLKKYLVTIFVIDVGTKKFSPLLFNHA